MKSCCSRTNRKRLRRVRAISNRCAMQAFFKNIACNQQSMRDAGFFQKHRVQSAIDARCRLFSKASRAISNRCAVQAFFKSIALHVNQSLTSSFTEAASPAMPWISDGMMILVACPSAAFWKASRLLSLMTASSSCASLMSLRPSAVA